MDSDAREKLFEMHGTVKRLEEKTDNMIRKQGEIESDINKLEENVSDVEHQAVKNQKKIYALFVLGGVASTGVVVFATLFSGAIN